MKIVRCKTRETTSYGILSGDTVRLLKGVPFNGIERSGKDVDLNEVSLLAPCEPTKIVAIGINYVPHARELDFQIPPVPLIFLKPPSAVIGPGETIILPDMSQQVDYEGELAVVIGRETKNISEKKALEAVFGYSCINDVTARDLQKKDVQFTRSKSFDTFAPFGPCIETELDPGNVDVKSYLNGELRQHGNTSSMIRSVPELISFISKIMTLYPGDVIATGTPAGVGQLQDGDTVTVEVDGIGVLINKAHSTNKVV
jgi:2-keto-4-pentenoate hydratase/2-oxohepta-3-ene-1,7-dioic acid hydratase in catechol pathway